MPSSIYYLEHAADVFSKASELIECESAFALVASVDIKGGSSRACGSLAIVDKDGNMHGYLSNGCIDQDIALRGQAALQSGKKEVVLYGSGSQNFDLKLPCGGSLAVLIDPNPNLNALKEVANSLAARNGATLDFALPESGSEGSRQETFTYEPKFRLYLAGRGAVFRSVVIASAAAGFEVEAFSPEADDLEAISSHCKTPPQKLSWSSSVAGLTEMDKYSAFLTLFHDHEWEVDLLMQALQSDTRFIGCMGSKRTHDARLERLKTEGITEDQLKRVVGPIGLVGSLRDATLIAVSTLAQLATLHPNAINRS